jgi:hypothetical protein
MTAGEESVQSAAAVAISLDPEGCGVVARLACRVELSQVHVCMTRAAFLCETRVANGRSCSGRERSGLSLVAGHALGGFVTPGQRKRRLAMREAAKRETRSGDRMTCLAPLIELPQMHIAMTTGATCGQGSESRHR